MPIPRNHKKKAVVIGAGFGGIATAIRLQCMGFQTTILEKRDKPGGRAYCYENDGFKFDAGPTVITAPESIYELFHLAEKDHHDYLDLLPVEPLYSLRWEDGTDLSYSGHHETLLKEIAKFSPGDVEGYERFLKYAEEVFVEGYEKLCHVPFLNFTDMIKVSPQLLKLKAHVPVYKTVSKFIKNEKLRQAFSFNSLLIGGSPFKASSIYTLIHPLEKKWGVSFPKGGTYALVKALIKLFEDIGGRVLLGKNIDQIRVDNENRATGVLCDGHVHHADIVVSNADVVHTYDKLLRNHQPSKPKASRLISSRHSMSLFVLYFGTNKKFPQVQHHNVLFCNRYKGLIDDIFEKGIVPEDFSIYLHSPCKTDPNLAPEGCEAHYALVPVPNLVKEFTDWNEFAPTFANKIISYLEQHYLPGLSESIVTKHHFSPRDFCTELHAHRGSAFSLEPTLTQSAWFRVHNQDKNIKNLYFAGAGTHPGAGVPGVIGSAKATSMVIYENEFLKKSLGMKKRMELQNQWPLVRV